MRERRFARLSSGRTPAEGYWPPPPAGMCLSSFVLLHPDPTRREVLVGKLNPDAPWSRIGALDDDRARVLAERWMLPACHLTHFESPEDAAHRILREQLGIGALPLDPPLVFSEAYPSRRNPELGLHWDLEFLFHGVAPRTTLQHPAWTELRFVDPSTVPRASIGRSHDEVLELAGYRIG